ncbi:trypsin-like serine protease [Prolixibacteraceae bacterium JC049]|nr:trypsin-like serine protease [Prolixibacteraceae bacterium JC049]
MKQNFLIILTILCGMLEAKGQLSEHGIPASFNLDAEVFEKATPLQPEEKVNAVLAERAYSKSGIKFKSYKYGERLALESDIRSESKLIIDDGKKKVWIARVKSRGAKSISLIFDEYHLTGKARLFAYDKRQKQILGAFTARNNKPNNRFIISPIAGEECVIELEVPYSELKTTKLKLGAIIHDYKGIVGYGRRPLGKSGDCNLEVPCVIEAEKLERKNASVRFLSNGQLCTGTLINNSKNDGTPYILTADHCIEDAEEASEAIFYFNYEAPFCGSFDGDPTHSISSSTYKTGYKKADFALVQLSENVPAHFRPFFAGWDVSGSTTDSTYCWHHPKGDNKKIAIDRNNPTTTSWNNDFLPNNFWLISRWEEGTTEIGSSGSALFNSKNKIIGSLSAGEATCEKPVNDLFSKLSENWEQDTNNGVTVKQFLNSEGTKQTLDGIDPYENDNCGSIHGWTDTNIGESKLISEGEGYYAGKNTLGWNEIIEHFDKTKLIRIVEIDLGVGINSSRENELLQLNIYEGGTSVGKSIYSQNISLKTLSSNSVNTVGLTVPQVISNDFYIGLKWAENLDGKLSFLHTSNSPENNFMIRKTSGEIIPISDVSNGALKGNLAITVHGCNIEKKSNLGNVDDIKMYQLANLHITKILVKEREISNALYFDLQGRQISAKLSKISKNEYHVSGLDKANSGIYIIQLITSKGVYIEKLVNHTQANRR